MNLNINIKSAKVLLSEGTDRIMIVIDDNHEAFPNMKYDSIITIETQYDKGVEYCEDVLGIECEIINTRN